MEQILLVHSSKKFGGLNSDPYHLLGQSPHFVKNYVSGQCMVFQLGMQINKWAAKMDTITIYFQGVTATIYIKRINTLTLR